MSISDWKLVEDNSGDTWELDLSGELYDPQTDTWNTNKQPMPKATDQNGYISIFSEAA